MLQIEDYKLNTKTGKIEIEAGRKADEANETYYISVVDFSDYVCENGERVCVSTSLEDTTQVNFYDWYADNSEEVTPHLERFLNKVEAAKEKVVSLGKVKRAA